MYSVYKISSSYKEGGYHSLLGNGEDMRRLDIRMMDGSVVVLHPFQQYSSHIRVMGG